MIIEMCDDIIRVSHGFEGCQMLEYIAESTTLGTIIGDDHITTLKESLKVSICWSNLRFIGTLIRPLDKELSGVSSGLQTCSTVCKDLQISFSIRVPQKP